MEIHIASEHLLIDGACAIHLVVPFLRIVLACLHAHIHEKQRGTQRELGNVIVIPHRLHRLIGLGTIDVISAVIYIFLVLVVTQDGVHLVARTLVTQS